MRSDCSRRGCGLSSPSKGADVLLLFFHDDGTDHNNLQRSTKSRQIAKRGFEMSHCVVEFIVCVVALTGKSIELLLLLLLFPLRLNIHIHHVLFSLCRPSYGDSVHRASLRHGGRESHIYLPCHRQSSNHGLQV